MPTLEHDGVVSLFRDNPPLALRLLESISSMPLPAHSQVRVANASLDQLIPIEFRADLVLEVLDERQKFVMAVVLEAQRKIDDRKKFVWPVYVTVSRAERECPAILLVVAVDENVADWASALMDLGLGRSYLKPVVLGPRTIPEITDEAYAKREVELALLSGMAHGNGTNGEHVLRATLKAIDTLDQELAMVYFQILWNVLRKPMQDALERLTVERQASQRKHSFSVEFTKDCVAAFAPFAVKEIKADAFEQGEVKGFHDGEVKGEVKTLRDGIFRVAQRHKLVLSDEQRERIHACDDRPTLDRWFDNVLDATAADDIFR